MVSWLITELVRNQAAIGAGSPSGPRMTWPCAVEFRQKGLICTICLFALHLPSILTWFTSLGGSPYACFEMEEVDKNLFENDNHLRGGFSIWTEVVWEVWEVGREKNQVTRLAPRHKESASTTPERFHFTNNMTESRPRSNWWENSSMPKIFTSIWG